MMTTLRMISNGDVAVVGIHVPDTPVRRPVHVALALDVSGSMEGERLAEVKRTLHAARGLFQADDRVTLVTFSDSARLICNHQEMDEHGIEAFYTAVDALAVECSTNMSAAFELLASTQHPAAPYSAIILLTDGVVNAGIVSTVGLRTMANSFRVPIHFLGYGPDHNRILGRDIATARRGTYTYVENNEVLPVAIGNILGGLRTEVVFGAKLRVEGWTCKEVGADDGAYNVGNLEAGRDYWFVFERVNNGNAEPVVELVDRDAAVIARLDGGAPEVDAALVTEQSLRCRVAAALVAAANAVEARQPIGAQVTSLRDEIQGLEDAVRMRPLVMRLLAQLEETIEMAAAMPVYPMPHGLFRSPAGGGPDYNHFATRMVSGGAVFGLQRGISGPGYGPELFASPSQALAAQSTSEAYSAADPANHEQI